MLKLDVPRAKKRYLQDKLRVAVMETKNKVTLVIVNLAPTSSLTSRLTLLPLSASDQHNNRDTHYYITLTKRIK